nr:PAS domain S-box protein [uncultured Flavobacterium sp.]
MKTTIPSTEDKYRVLFESNRDSITLFRIDSQNNISNFIEANPATTSLFGYTKKELLSMSIDDIETISENEKKSRIDLLLSKGKIDFETIIKDKNGINRNVEIETILINYEGEPTIMNITRDITERKSIEINSTKTQEKLTTILQAIPDLLFEVGIDGKIYYYQAHRQDLLAVSPDTIIGGYFQNFMPPDISAICFEAIHEASENGWSTGKQYALQLPQGKHWFEISASLIETSSLANRKFIFLARDITERKLAEKKLIANEKLLNQTQAIAQLGSYFLDFSTGKWTSSIVLDSIFGIDTDCEKNIDLWTSILHPDWSGIMTDYLSNVLTNQKTNFNKEYKIQKLNTNEERWVHGMGELTFDEQGNPLMMVGSIQDITDRKIAENALRKSEEKLKNIFNLANSGIIMADIEGNFLEFNNWWPKMTGYSREEYSKMKNFSVTHPDDLEKSKLWLQKIINGEIDKYQIEKRYVRKDKSIFWGESSVSAIKDKNNQITSTIGIVTDITERKLAEELLRESEEKYRGLVENSPDGIVTYVQEKITYANGEALRIVGANNSDQIIGKSVLEFVHPDSLESVIHRMKELVLDDNATQIVEEKLISLTGETIYAEMKAIPTLFEHQNAVQVIIHDISERKRTQEKIKQLSQAVEQSPVAIVITNTLGIIEYVNPKFIETTGYSYEELIGKNPRILKSGHTSQEEYKHLWHTLSSGNEWFGEFHNMKKDGTLYWESASISPILNSQGAITHYIAIKEDITERKLIEQQLIKAKEKAEESDRLKLAFLANMSHEIRTPMNGILGFTELLKDNSLDKDVQQDYIKIIEKSGKRMLNIINDIINISKVESGQIEITTSETNVNEQIEYLHTFFKPEASNKNISLRLTKELDSKHNYIRTDREKLYAILTNLIKNALKFTNEGYIEFGCEKKGDYLEFFVKDSGLGISDSQKKIIFERFRQANDTIGRTHEGSGLGLAISKAYVEMLGGKIWVESKEGIGSTFYFTLPYQSDYIPEEKRAVEKTNATVYDENKINNLKVLIVEDDAISKLLITIAVKPYSDDILKVSTGYEAVEACRNNPDIDLVMMDINMPEMGGYEATKQIRKFNKELVIIAQTANGMQSDHDNAIAAGCTDYISKPINISSLSKLIQKYFSK